MSTRVYLEWLTPLPWADPPFTVVQRIYRESRAARPKRGGNDSRHASDVSAEFHRRLEELSDVPNIAAAIAVIGLDVAAYEQTEAYWRLVWQVEP